MTTIIICGMPSSSLLYGVKLLSCMYSPRDVNKINNTLAMDPALYKSVISVRCNVL